ncbi:beta-galactosidase [Bifidobacterium callitrichos DSM 23973]|uniref:beta-galactosidase n=2 Tax=Bifidobacterium callitrichos TaxID=762209 RepID=A0A087A5V6_9BIFI|nr:beta-galactosidase [Bifidobacterium callitrichos DSM 23973]
MVGTRIERRWNESERHMSENASASATSIDRILFGCAYYDEYMPYDRLDRDIEMMKAAHINVVRIAESTWSTEEPQPGEFDFRHVDRVLDATERAGIKVIIGTPTYAVPSWLVRLDPTVLADTPNGRRGYGPRQIMDITNATYRHYGERIIRRLVAHVADRPNVIGYQVDNETKYYDVVSPNVRQMFVRHVRELFDGDLDALNRAWGLDYWSNRIDAWEDFPDPTNSINGSMRGEFDAFRRGLVSEYLAWQASIVREYARDDQFVTQNFDFGWKGGSYGVQPAVDHFEAARALDIAGADVYFPTQDELDGRRIAFAGDLTRGLKGGRNYLTLETEAQGNMGWLPYPGQLRLQAYGNLASGSDSVMYWHWHSIHNSWETYWKGILSHDFEPGRTYRDVAAIGAELEAHGDRLLHLTKRNRAAVIVSNRSLTALEQFSLEGGFRRGGNQADYNDVVRWMYDALYGLNIECDVIDGDRLGEGGVTSSGRALNEYDLVLVPTMYCASDAALEALRAYVSDGGHLVASFKSFFADPQMKVRCDRQPHAMTDVFGMWYNEFTPPHNVGLDFAPVAASYVDADAEAQVFMELLMPASADASAGTQILARYRHPAWGDYVAITRHMFGGNGGWAEYVGTMTSPEVMRGLVADAADAAGLTGADDWPRALAGTVDVRRGVNASGERIDYFLNYSADPVTFTLPVSGEDVLSGDAHSAGSQVTLALWDLLILAES